MSRLKIEGIFPRALRNQSKRNPPAGYICLVRDNTKSNRYKLIWHQDPKALLPQQDEANKSKIVLAFKAENADESGKCILRKYAAGKQQGQWFNLTDSQLRELRNLALKEPRRRNLLKRSAPSQRPGAAADKPAQSPPSSVRSRLGCFGRVVFVLAILALLAVGAYSQSTGNDPVAGISLLVSDLVSQLRALDIEPDSLSKPTFRLIEMTETSLLFAWNEVDGAHGYQYRYALGAVERSEWNNISGLELKIISLTPGDRVDFEIRASNGSKHSEISAISARTLPVATYTVALLAPASATETPSSTPQPSATATPSATASATATPSSTPGPTATATPSATASATATPSFTPEPTATPTPSATASATVTPSFTPEPTATSTPSATASVTTTPSHTPEPTATAPPSATASATTTPSHTPIPSATATSTATASFTPEPTPSHTPSATASATATASFTPEPTSTPSATATSNPTGTATSQIMEVETIGDSGANARACPQFNCRIRASLRPGTAIQALGQVPGDNLGGNSTWIEFEHNGAMAYMHSSLLKAK